MSHIRVCNTDTTTQHYLYLHKNTSPIKHYYTHGNLTRASRTQYIATSRAHYGRAEPFSLFKLLHFAPQGLSTYGPSGSIAIEPRSRVREFSTRAWHIHHRPLLFMLFILPQATINYGEHSTVWSWFTLQPRNTSSSTQYLVLWHLSEYSTRIVAGYRWTVFW